MILEYDVDMIVNIGVAGTLTKDFNVLDVAVATNVLQHDMDTSPIGDPKGLLSGINMILLPADTKMVELMCSCLADRNIHYKKGNIATGDQFIATKEQKDYISNTFDAIAAEMEGGSIGHVCYVNKVPFCVIRAISDAADGSSHMDYSKFTALAAKNSAAVMTELLRSGK